MKAQIIMIKMNTQLKPLYYRYLNLLVYLFIKEQMNEL